MLLPDMPVELALITQNAIRQPAPDLASPFFDILDTPYSGRGAFAHTSIPCDTTVFRCEEPFVSVVYKPFKKEVCAHCFFYDNGRKLKIAHMGGPAKNAVGLAWFCSEDCKTTWLARLGPQGVEAIASITSVLSRLKKKKSSRGDDLLAQKVGTTTDFDVEAQWRTAAQTRPKQADLVEEEDDEDTIFFLLDGIIRRHCAPSHYTTFLSLAPSLQPYRENRAILESHIRIYHFLRQHLPSDLGVLCTPGTVLALITRDHGNSFGIFETGLERDGEMLGYGSWTEASFFNHSCRPNLKKERTRRAYSFTAIQPVEAGDELCISYIGDSADMPLQERRSRLSAGWGFVCRCARCTSEEADGQSKTNAA